MEHSDHRSGILVWKMILFLEYICMTIFLKYNIVNLLKFKYELPDDIDYISNIIKQKKSVVENEVKMIKYKCIIGSIIRSYKS